MPEGIGGEFTPKLNAEQRAEAEAKFAQDPQYQRRRAYLEKQGRMTPAEQADHDQKVNEARAALGAEPVLRQADKEQAARDAFSKLFDKPANAPTTEKNQ